MSYAGGNSRFATLIIIIVSIVLFYLFIWKNQKFQEFISQLFSGINQEPQPEPQQPVAPPVEEEEAPETGGGGGISTETTCPGGETCVSDNDGTRMECDAEKGDSYEATWCGSFSGDQLTIKLYGPGHGNAGNCCWCNIIVHEDGSFQTGGEGPHSPNTNCEHNSGGSIGGSSNICVKATIEPGPTMVGYGLVDGQWKEMVRRTGECGCDETSDVKTGNQVAFRCDGNLETTCATVKPLGAGGTTPAPTTGGDDEEDEEEDNEDNEDDNEDDEEEDEEDDDNGNGSGTGPTCSCPNKSSCNAFCNSPSTFQTCCFGSAGLARVLRAKIGYSANQHKYGYRKSFARLSTAQREFDFNSYRSIRLGNF